MSVLAIDIGGTKFSACVFDDAAGAPRMTHRATRATDREGGREWMLQTIRDTVEPWLAAGGIDRCGIGFGGPVIFPDQRVALSTHVGGWSDFRLTEWAAETFCVPAVMDNDANAGALGEWRFGAGGGASPLFYMTLSTGIGGGIVNGGQLWRGADSYAGELGHMTIRADGPECLCGARGCLERLCCGLWLERDHGRSAVELLAEETFVSQYVIDLAQGLKSVIMLLNPGRIVIGGGIAKAGDALFSPLRRELRKQVTAWSQARIDVQPAALGDDSVLWGAFLLARQLTS